MSYPPPPSGQPTSFNINVNRAKTKRWVEAKSYSYDGDDWGEVDDYDEYGGYDEPQPSSRPTGLRQQGQSATLSVPAARDGRNEDHQPGDNGRLGYSNLGGQPIAQNPQGLRSTTHPQPHINTSLARSNSFDRGDEKRDFSAGGHSETMSTSGGVPHQAPGFQPGKGQPPPSQQRPKQGLPSQQGPYQQPFPQQDPYHASASQRGLLQTSRMPPIITDEHHLQSPAQLNPDQRQNQHEIERPPSHFENQPSGDSETRNVQHTHSQAPSYRGVSSSDQPRQSSLGSRTQSMTSNNSSLDFHNRRDFSPSAIPPPLQTQASPSSHSTAEAQSSARFPPRKSSLSQMNPPNIANPNQMHQLSPPTASVDNPSTLNESAGNLDLAKPRPFVRPADIYKRMQEEKEKERRSQDSSRPSVDTPPDRSTEGAAFSVHSPPNSSAGGQGNGPVRTDVNNTNTSEPSQNQRKPLDSVAERKSEYALEGVQTDDQKRDVKQNDNSSSGYQSTLRPILPDVSRMSGFGDLLINTTPSFEPSPHSVQIDNIISSQQPTPNAPSQDGTGTSLQHQPSAGFRSVVHQAFENVQDQIPATPSSTSGSGIGRSTSGGTSLISPIISRDPSVAKRSETAKNPETRASTPPPPPPPKDVESSGRPLSSSTLGTPKQIVRKPSPSQSTLPGLNEPAPTTFIAGHRRDLSTPSPDNSPARTPVLEPNRKLRKPQEVELAIATPIESAFPSMQGSQGQEHPFAGSQSTSSNLATGQNAQQITDDGPAVRDRLINVAASKGTDANKSPRDDSTTESPVTLHDGSTRSRAESPSKNRVRDLAGKFESGSPTRRGSDQSTGLPGVSTPRKDSIPQSRPLADRLESFRPQLPGGWESYSSTTPARASNKKDNSSEGDQVERTALSNAPDQPKETSTPGTDRVARAESPSKISNNLDRPPPKSELVQPSSNPFTAVAAAGSALAGAIIATVGGDNKDSPTSHPKEPQHDSSSDHLASTRGQIASENTILYPEASAPLMPHLVDEEDSSQSTTPLRKESLETSDEDEANLIKSGPKVASQNDTLKEKNSVENGAQPNPQSMLPPLSTNIRDHQYESDRLRREIVKNLSPRGVSEPTTAESESPWQDDSRLSAAPSLVAGHHDSMIIPSEYDSYWNGSNSGGEGSRTHSGHGKVGPMSDDVQQLTESIKAPPPLRLSTGYPNAGVGDTTKSNESPQRPDLQQDRYSWEKVPGEVRAFGRNTIESTATNQSSIAYTAIQDNNQYMDEMPVSPLSQDRGPGTSNLVSRSVRMVTDDPAEEKQLAFKSDEPTSSSAWDQSEKMPLHQEQDSGPSQNFVPFEETNLPCYTSGLPIVETSLPLTQNNSFVDGSFDTQANPTGSQSTAPPQPQNRELTPQMVQSTSEFTGQDNIASPSPLLSAQPKMPAFREILALKTPSERIRAFNETREQIANVNTGLTHWLTVTSSELPEDATILSGVERPVQAIIAQKPIPFKAKIPGLRSAGAQATQQPYYQQYLNATPQATSSEGIGGQNAAGSILSQGFSPSGGSSGKLSTQQVQAKGKDLLQAAGVFGGRANVAAKGLFSKGRSKLRGSSAVDKVTNPTPSPDPFSRGMQPQHQPQTEQTLSNQISSRIQPLPQESSNAQAELYFHSHGVPVSGERHSDEVAQGQGAQLSHTYEENQEHNVDSTKALPESNNELSVPEAVRALRHSSFQENNAIRDQNSFAPASSNEQVQTAIVEDTAPIFLHVTPTAESYAGSPKVPRHSSDASSNQTPTQADFDRSSQNVGSARPVLLDRQAHLRKEQDFDPSFESEVDGGPKDREDENQEEYIQAYPAPQSHDPAHESPSTDITHETNTDRQASNHASKQRFSERSDSIFHTTSRREEPQRVPETEAQSATQPQAFSQGRPQEFVARGGSSSQSGLIPSSQLQSAIMGSQRATRPFSFMEYSQDQPNQLRSEVLQRAPSIDSIPNARYPDRPPSPVSPQRSMTRDVSEQREQTVPTHYDTSHDFFPSDNGNGSMRRSRSFSRPFEDPNLLEHPAFRHESPHVRGADIPTEYHSAQTPREVIRLPRQQTTEYQLEGVGPPSIPRTDTKSRSRHSSRSSVFFRNLGNSGKVEGPSKSSPEAQFVESPARDAVASRKKSNRNSVFRTLTGRSGSDRDQTLASGEKPAVQSQNIVPQQPISLSPRNIETDFVSSGTSSKAPNKLQRASTSGAPEKSVVKKKRFSAIGTLFGRSSKDKQNSPAKFTRDRPQFERSIKAPTEQSTSFHQPQPQIDTEQYPAPIRQEASLPYSTSTGQDSGYYAPQGDYAHPPQSGYYAPGRSSQYTSNRSNSQAAQSHPKIREPPAYIQDSSLRQNSASRSQPTASPPLLQATAPMPETYPDLAQPRRSHWVRNPATHRNDNSYSSANTDDGSNSYRTQSIQNSQTQPTWLPPSQSIRQSYQRAPQTPNAPIPPPTTYSPSQSSSHNPSPNINNLRGNFSPSSNDQLTGSPGPPPPPPKDDYASTSPSQPSHSPFTTNTASSHSPAPSPTPQHQYTDTESSVRSSTRKLHPPPPIQTTPTTGTTVKNFRDKAARKSRQMEIERGSVGLPVSGGAVVGALGGGEIGTTHGDQHRRDNSGHSVGESGTRERGGQRTTGDVNDEDHIVMSSTSYPGQEWSPRWDGD